MIASTYGAMRAIFAAPGAALDFAGWETWPASNVLYAPESGFTLTLPTTLSAAGQLLTVNANAYDAVSGVDEFDWYLSQRSDDPASQMFTLARSDPGATRSGTVFLGPGVFVDTYGPDPSFEALVEIYRNVWIYAKRRSNGHIVRGSFLMAANLP